MKKIVQIIYKTVETIATVLLGFIAFSISFQIAARSLGLQVAWTEEMSRYAFVALVFTGSFLAFINGNHIVISVLTDRLSPKAALFLSSFSHVLIASFLLLVCYGMIINMQSSLVITAISLMWFDMNYLYWVVLVSIIGMLVTAVYYTIRDLIRLFSKTQTDTKNYKVVH